MDRYLDSINDILMEESTDDSHSYDASYQTIFRSFCDLVDANPPRTPSPRAILNSFCDIIGENELPPLSSVDSAGYIDDVLDVHGSIQLSDGGHHVIPYQRVNVSAHQILTAADSLVALPANGNLPSSYLPAERPLPKLAGPGQVEPLVSCNLANLNALSNIMAQGHRAGLKFSDGKLVQTSWGKKEQGYAHFHLPSPYKEAALELSGVELSFEELKLHENIAPLYSRDLCSPARAAPLFGKDKEKARSVGAGNKSCRKRAAGVQGCVDLRELVVNCARAVAVGDTSGASEMLLNIRAVNGGSPNGNGLQRAIHYFTAALEARMRGTGGLLFREKVHKRPAAPTILKAYKRWFEVSPIMQVTHYVANQSILRVAKRASRLHIVDCGLEYGMQWPCLISALAEQKGGPPLLVFTAIDWPQPGNKPTGRLEESGRRLAAYARTYGVPFQYRFIACSKWEDLTASSLHLPDDEVLVVNCINGLRHLSDEGADFVSPRYKFFTFLHSLNPRLLITSVTSASFNSSFFAYRFREALYHFSSLFDMVDTLWDDSPERLLKEETCFFRVILNIVACEGAERVERPETYRQWQAHIKRAGFKQLPISPGILSRLRFHVQHHYHKEFMVCDEANKWMLLGWRGRALVGVSAWEPCHH